MILWFGIRRARGSKEERAAGGLGPTSELFRTNIFRGLPPRLRGKESACNVGAGVDVGYIPG